MSFEKFVQPLRSLAGWSLTTLFFLTPLVFAPFTTEALEINKQVMMVILVGLAVIGLFGSMLAGRRVSLRGGWLLNTVPLVFLGVLLVSSIFSLAGIESWLGYGGQEYVSFLTAAAGVALFYVLVNSGDAHPVRRSLLALLISSSIVGLVTLLSFVGVYLIPFAFTHAHGFNTVGNINALVAWLIPVSLLGLGSLMVENDGDTSLIPSGGLGLFVRGLIGFLLLLRYCQDSTSQLGATIPEHLPHHCD